MNEYNFSEGQYDDADEELFYEPMMKKMDRRITKWKIPEYYDAVMMMKHKFKIDYDYQIDFYVWLRDTPDEIIFLKLGDRK